MFSRKITTTFAATVAAAAVAVLVAGPSQGSSGLPITTCGQVVTTNAFLTADLYCPGLAGVVVGASGITIDLKGFTLRGDRSGGHYGVDDSAGYDSVTIKNGVLRNFNWGVVGSSADMFSVSGVVASGNTGDGISIVGASPRIKSSTASGNGVFGFDVGGASAMIQSSTVSGNGLSGMYVGGASVKVLSSIASGNVGAGIRVVGASASVLSSKASGNGSDGIFVTGDAAVIKSNRLEANGFAGGASDLSGLGIEVTGYTIAPAGTNVAFGNDDPAECTPALLC